MCFFGARYNVDHVYINLSGRSFQVFVKKEGYRNAIDTIMVERPKL